MKYPGEGKCNGKDRLFFKKARQLATIPLAIYHLVAVTQLIEQTIRITVVMLGLISMALSATVEARLLLKDGQRHYPGIAMQYLEDHSHALTLDTVRQATNWQAANSRVVNLGFQRPTFWYHVPLATGNLSESTWYLEQRYPLLDELEVFVLQAGELRQHWLTGDQLPFSQRPFAHPHFVFPLLLLPNQRYDLYLRVRNTEAMEIDLQLEPQTRFELKDRRRSLVDGMFYGLILVMALYNLVIYGFVRDRSYLYFVFYTLSMWLFFASQKGVLYEWVLGDFPVWHHYSVVALVMTAMITGTLFFAVLLRFHAVLPKVWRTLQGAVVIAVLLVLVSPLFEYQSLILVCMVMTTAAGLIGLVSAIYLARQGSRTAGLLLTGWFVLLVSIVFMSLSKAGVFYNAFIADYGLRLGTSLEIIIFSFALSYRITEERRAKEAALAEIEVQRQEKYQAQALALQREIEVREAREETLHQQTLLNEQLEQLVHERTLELEGALEDLSRANRELEDLSSRDGLTGVYNRGYFDAKMKEEWARATRARQELCLMLVDLDHFKRLNDTYGHLAGDRVLETVARLLDSLICRPADFVARYGGEEFVVVLPNTPVTGGIYLADKLHTALAELVIEHQHQLLRVTASVGIASTIPERAQEFKRLVQCADEALYRAKAQGRAQYQIAEACE